MPAIQLSQLTNQIEVLLHLWEQPDLLLARLVDMLEYYADHLYQSAEQTRTTPTLLVYRIPPIVLRHMERAFSHAATDQPQTALAISDILWQHGYAETLDLAAAILGGLPKPYHPQVIQRLSTWVKLDLPAGLLTDLIELATRQVRLHSLADWLANLNEWLQAEQPATQQFALLALQPLIQDPKFENLPFIYRVMTPFIQNPPAGFVPELVDLIASLAQRSPAETTYFIRQLVTPSTSTETLRLLRRALPGLPEKARISLSPLLREPDGNSF